MKHQSVKDRLHEGEGMVRHDMSHSSHGMYRNEVEKPHQPMQGHMIHGFGMDEFKKDADPIAYGQASSQGCQSDHKKIMGQFKEYHWD
jgi:hypothetical protein